MWHEARRQEKKIRGLMVDYKKRAERRRQYYERIKQDPTQFVRVIGRQMPIHLEHSVALAAESPQSMMPWQGNPDVTIDRFDVRAHLDYISDVCDSADPKLCKSDQNEERKCSYERYRILVQNECTGVSEEQCLQQIYTDELFGAVEPKKAENDNKKHEKKAAIGYTYEDSTSTPTKSETDLLEKDEEEAEESSDEEIDLDIAFDVDDLTTEQSDQLNLCARDYGMKGDDYLESLHRDKEEAEAVRQARLLEEEKAQFSGRKSRRERRAYKDKRMKERMLSPPSYAARDSPTYNAYKKSSSSSRSRSPSPVKTKMKFITSFGGEDDDDVPVQGPSLPPPSHASRNDSKSKSSSYLSRKSSRTSQDRSRSGGRDRSRSGGRPGGRYGRSRSRGRSRYGRRQSRSRSRSWSRTNRRRYSRSRSRGRRSRSVSSRSSSRSRSRCSRWRSMRSRSVSSSTSRSCSRSPRREPSPQRQPTPPLKRYRRSSDSSSSSSTSPSPKRVSPPPIKRYRRPSLSSSNSSSNSDDDDEPRKSDTSSNPGSTHISDGGKVIGKSRGLGATNKTLLTPQERLRRRMQVQLNRQYKADKKAQREKQDKMLQQQLDREEELKLRGIEMRRREREKRHKEKEGGESTDEETWSGKNGDDSKTVIDDKPSEHRLDRPDDRQTDRRDTAWQTDRHDARDSTDWRADRGRGRNNTDWQTNRHHGHQEGDWRTDRHQTRDDWRGDRHQGHQGHRGDWRTDRYHWQADRRQSGRDGHSSDVHRSTYRRRSPSPRQHDQRSHARPTTANTSSRPPRLVDY